jgi:hypothetical protein
MRAVGWWLRLSGKYNWWGWVVQSLLWSFICGKDYRLPMRHPVLIRKFQN